MLDVLMRTFFVISMNLTGSDDIVMWQKELKANLLFT